MVLLLALLLLYRWSQVPPGHDAWVIGDEPCVLIAWQGFAGDAKR